MGRYRVIYNRNTCIGAAACAAVDPDNFEMEDDGLANLIGGEEKDEENVYVKEVDDLGFLKEAAEACPVQAIKVRDLKTDEEIAP